MTPEIVRTPGRGWTVRFDGWTVVLLDAGTDIVIRNGIIFDAVARDVGNNWLAPDEDDQ